VRSLATTTALIGAFAGHSPRHFNATPFWRHALATAVTARVLASQLKLNPDEAYTAGLLHDIGRLVLVTQFPAPYERVMAFRSAHDVALLAAEQAVLGLNHATVGLLLTQNWKFPPAMQQAVAHHHATELAGLPVLTLLVIAANVLAHALDLSQDPEALVPAVPTGLWAQLGLDEAALLAVLQQTEAQFEAAHVVLNT
jgi:putative nucleotidyltransferase with HDIG domain